VAAVAGDRIHIDDQPLTFSDRPTPGAVPWADLGVDLVLECSGQFRTPQTLAPYFEAGVQKVIVAAPVKEGALNIVYGINDDLYDPRQHHLLTAASCTTNCLAPVVKVIHEGLGIRHGVITTIHDNTNTQTIVDAPHKDLRRARGDQFVVDSHDDGLRDGDRADLPRAERQAQWLSGAGAAAECIPDGLRV
jgi:glyceraldehyde 3-phosphate dehydrogenase